MDNKQWTTDDVQQTMDSNGRWTTHGNQIVKKGTALMTAVGSRCSSCMWQMEDSGWQTTRQQQWRCEAS
jgi:hypothetical protein